MSDQVGNQNVGFLMTRLILLFPYDFQSESLRPLIFNCSLFCLISLLFVNKSKFSSHSRHIVGGVRKYKQRTFAHKHFVLKFKSVSGQHKPIFDKGLPVHRLTLLNLSESDLFSHVFRLDIAYERL